MSSFYESLFLPLLCTRYEATSLKKLQEKLVLKSGWAQGEGRQTGRKQSTKPCISTECAYLQRVFDINTVLKKAVPECWWWNLLANHHGQSAEWRLWIAEPVLSSAAPAASIPSLSTGVQWKWGIKGTIYCRVTDCAELGGTHALRLIFF